MINISESELIVMKVLWENSPRNLKEIIAELKDQNWSTNTIQTFLGRLVKKGALKTERQGKAFYYSPIIKKKDYQEVESKNFIERVYDGNIERMMLGFVKSGKLSEKHLQDLKKMLDKDE